MKTVKVAIIGAGLSGLYAAYLLEQQGISDYVVIEARTDTGGRILSASGFDLGPAWFWPDYQPELDHLVNELGLRRFEQYDTGDMLVEQHNGILARTRGYFSSPVSMRLTGGMGMLIDALIAHIDNNRIITGLAVQSIQEAGLQTVLSCSDTFGHAISWCANHVLLAMPPRLAAQHISFSPPLPKYIQQQWGATATWMAPHAKYIAVYDTPFWRHDGLSGQARSLSGPMGEIHDASMPDGRAALFGFLSIPAELREGISGEVLRLRCQAQLERLFGTQATLFKAEFLKDWAFDQYTATEADLNHAGQHPIAPSAVVSGGFWEGRLTGIASEWSSQYPGYLAGAIDAAHAGIVHLRKII
jgi:monoamine oxidase